MSQDSHADNARTIARLIQDIRIALLTTVNPDGSLHSRPMTKSTQPFDGTLWFITDLESGKVHEIETEHHVNIAFANHERNHYISLSGLARPVRDKGKLQELWASVHLERFPLGMEHPNLGLLRVDVYEAEYWDSPTSPGVQLKNFAKAS